MFNSSVRIRLFHGLRGLADGTKTSQAVEMAVPESDFYMSNDGWSLSARVSFPNDPQTRKLLNNVDLNRFLLPPKSKRAVYKELCIQILKLQNQVSTSCIINLLRYLFGSTRNSRTKTEKTGVGIGYRRSPIQWYVHQWAFPHSDKNGYQVRWRWWAVHSLRCRSFTKLISNSETEGM